MSADTLRRAAQLMRECAEAATPGPWWSEDSDDCWQLHGTQAVTPTAVVERQILKAPKTGTPYAEYWPSDEDAVQITSWHPLVALAVADLLDKIAWMGELDAEMLHRVGCDEAIAIARAYLGEQS